jgi:SAM-dependent methyltransferase
METPKYGQDLWKGERLETNIYNDVAVEHLHRYAFVMKFVKDKHVLDLASGEGYGSNLIAREACNVIGVDISQEALAHARQKYQKDNLKFLHGSASNVPVDSNSIDIVVSFETIEHHNEHEEMLLEIKRVLKPDGILIMSSPDKLNYTDLPKHQNPFHIKELYLEEFRELIKNHFNNSRILFQKTGYGSILVPEFDSIGFMEFSGNHDSILVSQQICNHVYNICVASDRELDILDISFFDGKDALDYMINSIQETLTMSIRLETEMQLKLSRSYKIGYALTYPLRLVKNILTSRQTK